jgi:hypothetical protein
MVFPIPKPSSCAGRAAPDVGAELRVATDPIVEKRT